MVGRPNLVLPQLLHTLMAGIPNLAQLHHLLLELQVHLLPLPHLALELKGETVALVKSIP